MEQLTLFHPNRIDRFAICTACGQQIWLVRHQRDGTIASEYVGRGGRCWTCNKTKTGKAASRRKKGLGERE